MRKHYGESLAKIILYGSYARGDYNEESDVDYLVLLDRENVSAFKEVTTTISDRNDYYLETFIDISAVVVSHSQYLTSNRIFFRQVRRDGKCIYERRPEQCHFESASVFTVAEGFLNFVKGNYA